MTDITWVLGETEQGGVVATAFFGRCRVTQYPNGGIMCALPALPTEEETRTRRTLFERAVDTGKIWVES